MPPQAKAGLSFLMLLFVAWALAWALWTYTQPTTASGHGPNYCSVAWGTARVVPWHGEYAVQVCEDDQWIDTRYSYSYPEVNNTP